MAHAKQCAEALKKNAADHWKRQGKRMAMHGAAAVKRKRMGSADLCGLRCRKSYHLQAHAPDRRDE